MNLAHWLQRSAHTHPETPAIAHGTEVWCDYAGFAERAARTASWLQAQGVEPGDRVALFMYNCPEYLVTQFAAFKSQDAFPALLETFDDPFFEQPYEAPAAEVKPAWEAPERVATGRISPNIKPKRKVAALFKSSDTVA